MPRQLIDVTSLNRPDDKWIEVDAAGHTHFWRFRYLSGAYGVRYSPNTEPFILTAKQVESDRGWWDEEDGWHPFMVWRCLECDALLHPGYCADNAPQYIEGLRGRGIHVPSGNPMLLLRVDKHWRFKFHAVTAERVFHHRHPVSFSVEGTDRRTRGYLVEYAHDNQMMLTKAVFHTEIATIKTFGVEQDGLFTWMKIESIDYD